MRIKLSPQVRTESKIWYDIEEDMVTVTVDNTTDIFDFRGLPDGALSLEDNEGNSLIETSIEESPILSAERVNGELSIELIFSIDLQEDDERLLFPKWLNLKEFNDLMSDIIKRKEEVIRREKEEEDAKRQRDYLIKLQEQDRKRLAEEEAVKIKRNDELKRSLEIYNANNDLEDWDDF